MSRFVLRLPQDLYERVQQEAARQGVSINQYLMYNITRAVTAQNAGAFFRDKARGADRVKTLDLLDRVADRPPVDKDDRMPAEQRQAPRRPKTAAGRHPRRPASARS